MSAYRCGQCGTNWPPSLSYTKCPDCDVRCDHMYGAEAIDAEEASIRLRYRQFEDYYAQREAKRAAEFAAEMTTRMAAIEEA